MKYDKTQMQFYPSEPFVIAKDWKGREIYSDEDTAFFDTDEGLVEVDERAGELYEYMYEMYCVKTIEDILQEANIYGSR